VDDSVLLPVESSNNWSERVNIFGTNDDVREAPSVTSFEQVFNQLARWANKSKR
jgi:hypothetical protein